MRGRCEIAHSKLVARSHGILIDFPRQPDAVRAGRRAKNPQWGVRRKPARSCKRVHVVFFFELAQRPHGLIEERDLSWKDVAEEPGNSQSDIDARMRQA